MSIEQNPNQPIPEQHTSEMEQVQAIWQALSTEHKVALALNFVDEIMAGEYRPYFLYLKAQKWPLKTEEMESAYPRIEITERDLVRANLDEEEIAQLTPEDRQQMSHIMRSHYIHDLFWPEVRHLARIFVEATNSDEATYH